MSPLADYLPFIASVVFVLIVICLWYCKYHNREKLHKYKYGSNYTGGGVGAENEYGNNKLTISNYIN